MAVPLIYGGIMLGKFLIPTIARYIIKNGAKQAIRKYGAKVVKNAKVVKQVKQLKQAKPPKSGPKAKVKPKGKPKPTRVVKPKPKPKPKPVVKGKLTKALPAIVGGGLLLGGLVASMKGKKKDDVKVTVRDKPQRDTKFTGQIPPKNITKSVLPKKEQKRTGGSKPTMKISSYEDRVRAMVAKKDSLKNIDAADGSGRNKYQVEMNRLKKENPKEFRKLFTMGGLGKLKD